MNYDELQHTIKLFEYYKTIGEKSISQLSESELLWQYNDESNSIAIIIKHLSGNMKSRWTDFLTTDGEKEWRQRDNEFENDIKDKKKLLQLWDEGWICLFKALNSINKNNIDTTIYIRSQAHTISDAVSRQLAHYSYHVGQIVCIAKMLAGSKWNTLSIPKGGSESFNQNKSALGKHSGHFTDNQ